MFCRRTVVVATVGAIGIAWIAASVKGWRAAPGRSHGPQRNGIPITSVFRRGDGVFASTPIGLFRAHVSDRRWRHVTPPATADRNGQLAGDPSGCSIYYACQARANLPTRIGGLYVSTDDGRNWRLLLQRNDLRSVFSTGGGRVFVVATTPAIGKISGQEQVLTTELLDLSDPLKRLPT